MRYFLILLIVFLSGCFLFDDESDCLEHYTFDIPISVMPISPNLKIGDTLQVSMYTDNTRIFDSFGDRNVFVPNFDPNITFLLAILDSIPAKDGLLLNEIIINNDIYDVLHQPIQTMTSGLFWLEIDTTEFNSKLEFSIVFQEKGTYALYSFSSLYLDQDEICFPDKCGGCGKNSGTIEGFVQIENENHREILTEENINAEDDLWEERSGTLWLTDSYYFRVSK